jgi:sialate O-acetylesterase
LSGFLFYQGENNVESYASYRDRFVAMIRDWRTRFGQGTRPFLFVQLAGFAATDSWPYLREAQAQASDEPGCYMATAIDVGDAIDIHPKDKQTVADRLARLALANCYDQSVPCFGPTFRRYELEGRAVRVYFEHAETLSTVDGCAEVKGFALAGRDGQFHPAVAHIDGEAVVASASQVTHPVAVRYAFRDYQALNLVNGAGLPALPFRTDGASPM